MYKYLMMSFVVATIVGLVITKNIADKLREETVLEKRAPITILQNHNKVSINRTSTATKPPVLF